MTVQAGGRRLPIRILTLLMTAAVVASLVSGCGTERPPGSHYVLQTYWTGKGIPGGVFFRPFGIGVGRDGDVYVTDGRRRVVRLDHEGKFVSQWGGEGEHPVTFSNPAGVAVTPGGAIYVSDYDQDVIRKFTPGGKLLLQFGRHGIARGEFDAPAGLSLNRSGDLYVADFYNHRVQQLSAEGQPQRRIGHPGRIGFGALHYPTAVASRPDGGVVIADAYNYQLQWFDRHGHYEARRGYRLLWLWPRPAEGSRGFNVPTGVAVAPDGIIHVADSGNHRVVMLSADGAYVAEWKIPGADPRIFSPEQIAVAPDGRTVYATDLAANRVIVLSVELGSPNGRTRDGEGEVKQGLGRGRLSAARP